jgi:hypothetical protein
VKFTNLTELYQYLDELVCQDICADELFASSYLRGFISLAASDFGDESQSLTIQLAELISDKVKQARTELSPDDRAIVNNYWQQLKGNFVES